MQQDLLLGEHGGEEREHGAHPQLLEQQRHARPRGRHARVGHVTNLDKVAGVGTWFKMKYTIRSIVCKAFCRPVIWVIWV